MEKITDDPLTPRAQTFKGLHQVLLKEILKYNTIIGIAYNEQCTSTHSEILTFYLEDPDAEQIALHFQGERIDEKIHINVGIALLTGCRVPYGYLTNIEKDGLGLAIGHQIYEISKFSRPRTEVKPGTFWQFENVNLTTSGSSLAQYISEIKISVMYGGDQAFYGGTLQPLALGYGWN